MAASDFLGDLGVDFGSTIGGGGSGFVLQLVIFVLVAIGAGVGAYLWAAKRAYNKKIHIFEEINDYPVPTGLDQAKQVLLPFTSVKAFFLKKNKIFIPRPSKQTGKGHYWYLITQDGEWHNVSLKKLESLSSKHADLEIKEDHSDMRMQNAALKKLVEKNYKKLNWIKEYAPYIAMGLMIFLLGLTAYLVIGEASKIYGGISGNIEAMNEMTKEMGRLLSSVDNIKAGSGIKPLT